jgi:hypothetical protein
MPSRTKGPARDKRRTSPGPTAKRGVVLVNLPEDKPNITSYGVAAQLRNLLKDKNIPASARVTAARTLAEIEGLVGRFQPPPERIDKPVSSLSRDELVSELERLRTLVDLGLIP